MADKSCIFCKMIFSSIRDMIRSTSGRSISRILSGRSLCLGKSSIWAARHRAARCSLPGAVRRRAVSHRPWTISPLLGLAPGGGYLAACITASAGGLLHHLFTITTPKRVAVCFCGPIRRVSPPRMLSDAVLYGVRTFLDPDNAEPQLPNQPEVAASYTLEGRESTLAGSN